MDRKDFHFNPDTATYEQLQVYNFFKQLHYNPARDCESFIKCDVTPELLSEEAFYLYEHSYLISISDKMIHDDLSSFIDTDDAPICSNTPPKLPSLNLNQYQRTKKRILAPEMIDYVFLAIKMLILQKEIFEPIDDEFLFKHSITVNKQNENKETFQQLHQWLVDALNNNPRPKKYNEEYIWNLFNSDPVHLSPELENLVISSHRGFHHTNRFMGMYYYPTITAIYNSIQQKYTIEKVHQLQHAFNDSLLYNKQRFKVVDDPAYYSLIVESEDGLFNEEEFQQRIAQLYLKVYPLYDDSITRDQQMIIDLANSTSLPAINKTLLSIDLIIKIRSLYLEIKTKREFLNKPDLLANNKTKKTTPDSPEDKTAFDQMVEYARNRFKNEEMQTIVKMLMHVYHSDEKKYAIIEQIEPEWIELHTPKTTVTVENGASYNEIHDNKKVDLSKQS